MLPFQQKRSNAFFALLAVPATAVGFSLSTQVAVLSWILSTKYDLHIEDVALVWLAGPISGIIAQPIVGAISDKSWFWGGRRRPFIAIGGILGGLMMLGLLKLDAIAAVFGLKSVFVVAVVVSLLLDMSINVTFNPARAIIADLTPVGPARTKGYSWMQMISGSFSIGAYFISVAFGNVVLMYVAAILTEKIDTSKMGQYMGLFNSCVVLPAMMTVGVSTWVRESGDDATLFLMAGLSLSVSFIFWFFVKEKK